MLEGLKSLNSIYLNYNFITEISNISFLGFSGLQKLSLDGNPLQISNGIQFFGLQEILYFSISNCNLEQFHNVTINGLDRLQTLDLSANQMSSIDQVSVFGFETKSISIDLSWNQIDTLHTSVSCSPAIKDLNLRCNPIHDVNLNFIEKSFLDISIQLNCLPCRFKYLSDFSKIQNKLVKNYLFYFYWFLDELDYTALNKNLVVFNRKRIQFPNGRLIRIYESFPVIPRNFTIDFDIEYFFQVFRQCKIYRLFLGDNSDYDEFITKNMYKVLDFL